tara:strand:- start:1283 stop:1609 length:327 start_codon:yes stop_codon:yes gene_type:complete
MRINIKPLSVNQAWKGRRFKSDIYKKYEKELLFMLPNIEIPAGKLELNVTFGLSSKLSDYDNPLKVFQDVLCKKCGFDDRRIYKGVIVKVDVKKGQEFIEFHIKKYII